MRILGDGRRHPRGVAAGGRVVAVGALRDAPPVVRAAGGARGLEVDLLPRVLPDVADEEVARLAVEREPPGIAQAVGPDLGTRRGRGRSCERIGGRDAIGRKCPHVDAKNLPEQGRQALPVVIGISPAPAVPHPDVEVAVGTERELPAVVVRERLRDLQENGLGARRVAREGEQRDRRVAVHVRVVGPELALRTGPWLEGDREEAALAAAAHAVRDVQERSRQDRPVPHDLHAPALLDDEEPARAVARGRHLRRVRESARHPVQRDPRPGGRGGGEGGQRRGEEKPSHRNPGR